MTLERSFDIAVSGMDAQASRIEIHANNVANATTPNYVRKVPVLTEDNAMSFQEVINGLHNGNGVLQGGITASAGGVKVAGVMEDPTPGKKIYQPGHPEADKDGYVTYSNVDIVSDMADATSTARLYEANIAVYKLLNTMENRAMDIGKGG